MRPPRLLFGYALALILTLGATATWSLLRRDGATPSSRSSALTTSSPAPRWAAPIDSTPRVPARTPAISHSALLSRLTYAQVPPSDPATPLGRFHAWSQRYLQATSPAERAALEAEGLALAQARRPVMKDLIQRDPQAALEATLPAKVVSQLPAAIAREVETRFSAIGNLSAQVVESGVVERIRRQQRGEPAETLRYYVQWNEGPEYRTYVYGLRDGMPTKHGTPLHGILLDGVVALHESAIRVLEPDETHPPQLRRVATAASAAAPATSVRIAAQIGGQGYLFAAASDLEHAVERFSAVDQVIGPNQTSTPEALLSSLESSAPIPTLDVSWTKGNKKVLIIRVDFSDLPGDPRNPIFNQTFTQSAAQTFCDTNLSPFYARSSRGVTTLTCTVTPQVFRLPRLAVTYAEGGLANELHAEARAAAAAAYNLSSYDIIAVLSSTLSTFAFPNSRFGVDGQAELGGPRVWFLGGFRLYVTAHEIGHNLGLVHANRWIGTDANPLSDAGSSQEYGDSTDMMGGPSFPEEADFNPFYKQQLGWVTDDQVQMITTSGTYRVNRYDNDAGGGVVALRIKRDATRDYWVSVRRRYVSEGAMNRGVVVHWTPLGPRKNVMIIDPTPSTGGFDATFPVGTTLTDLQANLSLTVLATGGTAPNEYADVQINLGLDGAPVIAASPPSQGVSLGGSFTLSAIVTGTAPLTYQWLRNGLAIPNATQASFTVASAQAASAGSYSVRISNAIGSTVSEAAEVSLFAAPRIIAPPVNLITTAGRAGSLTVGAAGFPVPSAYQWRKGGANVPGATQATLLLADPQASDAGTYDVVVTNTIGSVTSPTVTVVVKPVVTTPPANDNFAAAWTLIGNSGVALGSNLSATGETGEPVHVVAEGTGSSVWYRWTPTVSGLAQVTTVGSRFNTVLAVYTGSSLAGLVRIGEDDNGIGDVVTGYSSLTFPVTAGTPYSLAVGSVSYQGGAQATLNYKAIAPATITTQPTNAVGAAGGTVTFSVGAAGEELTYQWMRNGTPIPGATGPTLALAGLTISDAGTYSVIVSNLAGSVTSTPVTLSGSSAPPTITTQPVAVTAIAGQPATLAVTATGAEALGYQWRRNGLPVAGATNATLTFASASRTLADSYDVEVSSGLSVTTSQRVHLFVAPSAYPGSVGVSASWNPQPEISGPQAGLGESVVALDDGRTYITGEFSSINGLRRTGIARLNADGTPDPTFVPPEIDAKVRRVAVQADGKVVIAGEFQRVGSSPRIGLARLNTDGSLDASFDPKGSVDNTYGLVLAIQSNGKILVGGGFSSFAGTTRGGLICLNADGSLDPTFQTADLGGGVLALAVQADGKILAGGWFSNGHRSLAGVTTPRSRLARLNADGSLDSAFAPSANATVYTLTVLSDGKILVGGDFTTLGAATVGRIAKLAPDGTLDSAFATANGSGFDAAVYALAPLANGKIMAGGEFSSVNGTGRTFLARLNGDGSHDTSIVTTGMSWTVNAIVAHANGKCTLAGYFSTHRRGGSTRTRPQFARIAADGELDAEVNLTVRKWGEISAFLPLPGGQVIVAGNFSHLRGTLVPTGIGRLNLDGTPDPTFAPGNLGANAAILAATLQPDGRIVIAGDFTSFNGTSFNRLARLNANGSVDSSFVSGGVNDRPLCLALASGGRIVVGGIFTTANNTERNRIAVFTASGSLDASFNPGSGADDSVQALVVLDDDKLILGGSFLNYNGAVARRLVRLNRDGTRDATFDTSVGGNGAVQSLALQIDGKLIVSGYFTGFGNLNRNGLARVNTNGSTDTTFAPVVSGRVVSLLAQEDGKTILRGSFTSVGGTANIEHLARLNANGTRDTTFAASGFGPQFFPAGLVMRDSGQLLFATSGPAGTNATAALAPPTIATPPQGGYVVAGAPVTLAVAADSGFAVTYQWKLNTAAIAGATDATYSLASFQAANAGSYTVTVTNAYGSVTSPAAVLSVGVPAAVTTAPASVAVNAGGSASFTVVATGTPAPTFQWQRQAAGTTGFVTLVDATGIAGATTATLTLTGVTAALRDDQFRCVLTNGVGSPATSAAATLTVNVPPAFTSQPASRTVIVGQPASFTAAATGTPAPTFQWRRAGTAVAGATAATFTLPSAQFADAGSYDVVASNAGGSVTSNSVTLTVDPLPTPPVILTHPQTQSVADGTTLSLNVLVDGTAPFSYQWRKDGAALAGATAATYVVANATAAVAGRYSVVVTNAAGSATSNLATVSIFTGAVTATHAVVGAGYSAGGTVTITNTLSYSGTATALGWQVLLPANLTFASDAGSAGDSKPVAGTTDLLEWAWTSPPASPVTFTYTLNVPAGQSGDKFLVGLAIVRLQGGSGALQVVAKSDPLLVPQITTHSADTDRNFRISLLELTRVIELYNTRNGTTRTGCYKVQDGSEDGFAAEPTRASNAAISLGKYHSADANHDGKVSLLELTRVIELYNYRSGTTRTGQYKVQAGTEDGYASGP